ncbi:poly(A) polymerase [Desulfuromonas versatilis]|uniref:Poly(A) polymerase n=1 Tax=Desulfuromonas versatilis TaxID=2802975 RepID=A0ABM8HWQ9_9BACT|nr:CBS domain-containing protein [Desulfuromonas versatilis]BCR05163.1 poly(A) polymerase [Desulfuromonas versatilis]
MDVITTHVNADFDCLGGMIAARKLYPEAQMVFAGAQERSLREFFLQSAVYAHGFKRVRDIDLAAVTRLILVDVRQSDRIGPFGEVARRKGVEVHIYDHHPAGKADLQADFEVIRPVGATVTVFCQLFMEKGIVPTPDEATMMMLGLYEDTGSLLFNSTTAKDYQAAAFLLEHGANLNTVADFLTQEMSAEQVALLHELIQNRTVLNVNGVDISIAHASVENFVGDLAVLTHKLKDMENLDALLVAARMGDRVFLVGRSRVPEVPVGEILAELGGGGHSFAGSGTVRDLTLVQVLDRLPEILRRHVNPQWQARHLMSFPVKGIGPESTIREARTLLTRYNINTLPVMDGPRVVGLLSRQVADKAAHHGLADVPAREYMSTEFASVASDSTVDELKELIVVRSQRFVPVVEKGRAIGVVTRTDLLRHMVSGMRSGRRREIETGINEGALTLKKRQVARLIREQLPSRVLEVLQELGVVGDALQCEVFAVGGFVRDLLLRQPNLDVDIVVEGDGIAFASEFARRQGCRIRSHQKFGTAVIIFPDGFKVDVASTRMEYYLEPGALPTVEDASIKLDLYRRDFTINTLAIALNGPRYGELLDFFGGQRDLEEKAVRVLHNLSFVEDPTRVFRAIRFEQRLGFRIGVHTEHLLRSAVRMGFVDKVGGARVFNELVIILKEANPVPAVARMAELQLLKYLHPALVLTPRIRQRFEEASRVIHWHELLYTGEPCQGWLVYFLCLTVELDKDAMEGICRRLAVPARYVGMLCEQRAEARSRLQSLERRRARGTRTKASELYQWLKPLATEVLLAMMAQAGTDEVRQQISHFFTHLRNVSPLLDGNDLLALGIPPGPQYKVILHHLLQARLDGRVLTRDDELALVRKRYFNRGGPKT